jgi:Rieske Fe-S protein
MHSAGRRKFVGESLMLLLLGCAQRLRAQAVRFHRLARPVPVPLADLTTPGRARSFIAEGVTLSSAATPNQPIRISGMVVRTGPVDDRPDRFSAVCTRCPHEHCDVDFMTDPSKLPTEVLAEIGRVVDGPVYLCPCHNSTFNAADGERLSGPAPRGLYRFRVTAVSSSAIEIGEVEEDVLLFN